MFNISYLSIFVVVKLSYDKSDNTAYAALRVDLSLSNVLKHNADDLFKRSNTISPQKQI